MYSNSRDPHPTRPMKSKSASSKVLNPIVIAGAFVFLLCTLAYFVISAFALDLLYGLRSLVACFIPVLVAVYIGSFTRVFQSGRPNQNFNVFFIYTLLTLMALIFSSGWQFVALPLPELAFSTLLASVIWRTRKRETQPKVLTCCYGILTGLLTFVCFFGLFVWR